MKTAGKRKTKFFITAAVLSFVAGTAALIYKVRHSKSLHKVKRQYWQ